MTRWFVIMLSRSSLKVKITGHNHRRKILLNVVSATLSEDFLVYHSSLSSSSHKKLNSGMNRLIGLFMWLGRWTVDIVTLQWGIKRLAVSTDWLTEFCLSPGNGDIPAFTPASKAGAWPRRDARLSWPVTAYRVDEQPEADAGVREVPGTAGEEPADTGRLRPAAGWPQARPREITPRTHGVLREPVAPAQRRAGTGAPVLSLCCTLLEDMTMSTLSS